MDISKLNKARVLAALYNHSKPQGLGFLHFESKPMTKEGAQELLDKTPDKYFDYVKGRVLKVNLNTGYLNTAMYDRDLGPGAAEYAILDEFTRP